MEKQPHVEFARDISMDFNRWLMASDLITLTDLKDLLVLERFKN